MPRGRRAGVAAVLVTLAGPGEALAEEPLPWSRGTLAPGVAIGVTPTPDVTSLSFGVGLDWFVARGFSLGLHVHDELLVYSASLRGRLPEIEGQLPTNIFYLVPTARWVFFRRFRFSPYVFAGVGPAFLNNDNGILGHWQAGPSAYIGLVGGLFLDLGVVFSGHFPGTRCDGTFVYRPPEPSGTPVPVGECAFSWAPKIGLAYAFGFAKQRERRRREAEDRPDPQPEPAPEPEPRSAAPEVEPLPESDATESGATVPDAVPRG